jgi:hypothetical protein
MTPHERDDRLILTVEAEAGMPRNGTRGYGADHGAGSAGFFGSWPVA